MGTFAAVCAAALVVSLRVDTQAGGTAEKLLTPEAKIVLATRAMPAMTVVDSTSVKAMSVRRKAPFLLQPAVVPRLMRGAAVVSRTVG